MSGRVAYEFGRYRFEPFNARLVCGDRIVSLPAKANRLLDLLIQQADVLVSKDTLIAAVWPDIAVEENNLNQQISLLRKALAQNGGPQIIETVPRRGYRFVAPVTRIDCSVPLERAGGNIRSPAEHHAPRDTDRSRGTTSGEGDGREAPYPAATGPEIHPPRRGVRRALVTAAFIALAVALGWGWQQQRPVRESRAALERGNELLRQGNPRAASQELQDALRLNPANARAHGAFAWALHKYSSTLSPSAIRRRGQSPSVEAAARGVALDPRCGECQGTLGFFLFYDDWEWDQAESHLREAVRLEPDRESIRPSLAMLLSATGRQAEAMEQVDFALRARPYHLTWLEIRASILYHDRRYDEAIAAADVALDIDDGAKGALEWRSKALFKIGRDEEAVRGLVLAGFPSHATAIEGAILTGGGAGGLRKLLEITSGWPDRVAHSWRRAPWLVLLGEHERALDEVETIYETRRFNAIHLGVDPVYDAIRSNPRFQKVLARMGLKGAR